MTPEQQDAIARGWEKVRSTAERIARAGEALKNAGLAKVPDDQMQKLDGLFQDAIGAHSDAVEEVADILRGAGVNI